MSKVYVVYTSRKGREVLLSSNEGGGIIGYTKAGVRITRHFQKKYGLV
jgi:hypothetical protein